MNYPIMLKFGSLVHYGYIVIKAENDWHGVKPQVAVHRNCSSINSDLFCSWYVLVVDIIVCCCARAKRILFSAKSARTLAHFIMWTHFTA